MSYRNSQKPTLLDYLDQYLRRRGVPALGHFGLVIGLGGMLVGTLAIAAICAVVFRAALSHNYFGESDIIQTAPDSTPNPDLLAPTLDIGNAYAWQGNDRVTVLLMGSDTRPVDRGVFPPRTDTMMLLMVDPVEKQASILSIPRDLYVDVPGHGLQRVNTGYFFGGGPLAVETVEYNLGIRVNYYAMIEFNVFVRLVDEIGGIDINVPQPIYDGDYPTYDFGTEVFYIQAGVQHLDGETALKYARTRATAGSDYDRAGRQQDVIFAIREKVLSTDMLPALITRAPTLYSELQDSIATDMSLDQMLRLAVLAKDVPRENIRTGIIDSDYVISYRTEEGAMVEIPNRANIGQLLTYVFWLQ